MKDTHKKLYFHKYKRTKRSSFAVDPISSGMRASILDRVDNIYNHIQQLHNKSSFIKTFVTERNSFTYNKIKPSTQRLSVTANNFRKTSRSVIKYDKIVKK